MSRPVYPLDDQGIQNIFNQFIAHHQAQVELIGQLSEHLREAMTWVPEEGEGEWYDEAKAIMRALNQRKMDFENFRFDQGNGHKKELISPYEVPENVKEQLKLGAGKPLDPNIEGHLNQMEASLGKSMTVEELAKHFGETPPEKVKKGKSLSKMSLEEINEWEAAQNNSNDIYKIAARMKNAARFAVQGNLTAQGVMVVNTFVHMVKAFYDFANTVPDKDVKYRLTELTRKQEELPANLISALWAGVKDTLEESE